MNVILRDETFTHMTDYNVEKAPDVKVGDTFKHQKIDYEVVEVNKSSEQVVLTLKRVVD